MSNHPAPPVGFDFETFLIRPGLLCPPPVCLTYSDGKSHGIEHAAQLSAYDFHDRILSPGGVIVGANTAFDMGVACAAFPELVGPVFDAYEAGRVRDVQIDQKMIDNAHGRLDGWRTADGVWVELKYSLADLEKRLLGRDRSADKGPDAWRMRYCDLYPVPLEEWPEEAVSYAIADAEGAALVHERQEREFGRLLIDAPAQAYAAWSLHLMSAWGLKTDPDGIAAFRATCEDRFAELKKILEDAGILRVQGRDKGKPGSRDTKKAKDRMVAAMKAQGLEPRMTAGSEKSPPQVSLDADACEDSNDPVLEAYAEMGSLSSVVKDHIPALLKGVDLPIQPGFNSFLATGRTSCKGPDTGRKRPVTWCPKQGLECILEDEEHRRCVRCGEYAPATNGFQTQNVRRLEGIRECFVSRPGMLYIDCDFGGLELCTWAQVCKTLLGWSDLGDAINAGLDAHLEVGAELLGISYEDAKHRKGQGDKEIAEARGVGKVANFGFPGGLGIDSFVAYARKSYGMRLDYVTAAQAKAAWSRRWSESTAYFQLINDLCGSLGAAELVTLFTSRVRGMCSYTESCNGFFQALGADVAKRALNAITRTCYVETDSILFGSRPVNFVHDQIITETPELSAHEAAFEHARIMCEAGNVFLPDVPVKCVPALSKRWSKGADAVFDAPPKDGGRLVAWDLAKASKRRVWNIEGEEVKWKA
jgi:DNA polymerase-1